LEDEPADVYLLKTALKENNIVLNLHHVIDGQEGLNFLQKVGQYAHAPRPDLIFLDLNMPRMNGYEFLTAIKADELSCDIPVIVLTTSDAESDVTRAYKLGAASYIAKPLDISQFITTIRQVSEYWLKVVRLPQGHKL
jgi:CheY-like chemotaxis protein